MIGRANVEGGVALITPTKRTDSTNLSVALERDNFIATTLPVSSPVPSPKMTCPPDVNVPSQVIKIPMGTADIGKVKIEAFFDGANKYGADDAVCTVEVF